LVIAHQDPSFRQVQLKFDLILSDGIPGVWVGRIKGARSIQRYYGPDFFKELMAASRTIPMRHFLCGGKESVAEQLRAVCEKKFGNPNVVGCFTPPFREMSDEEYLQLAEQINSLEVDIVWIGISTPKQERFAVRLAQYTQVHFICTVGAAFDFHTDRVREAPRWMQQHGLEWFFRLITEPRRLWRRYIKVVPLFIFYNLEEFIKGLLPNRSANKKRISE